MTIAALACVLGIALARLALATIDSRLGSVLPPGAALHLDATAWAIAGAVAGIAALLVGIFPALQITRSADGSLDTSFARGLSESAATQGMRRLLVTAEVALSAFLLVGAALFIGSLDRALRVPVGFEPDGLAAGEITLPSARYAGAERQRAFFFDVLERVQRQPRVIGAAIVFGVPFAPDNYVSPYVIAGQPIPPPAERRRAGLRIVSEDYFTVMGSRLLQGRAFTAADRAGAQQVCIINASLAKRQFAARSPLGAVVLRGRDADQRFEIVGVVDDIKTNGPTNPAPDELFLPFRQVPRPNASMVIRTASRPDTIAPALQSAVFAVDPDLPVAGFATITDQLAATLGPEQILAQLTAAFAVVALLLAGVGLYAVLAHAVAARAPEIGIRMAVGADRPAILRLVIAGALRLVVPGIAIGLLAAVGASHLVTAQLHEISPRDPFVYAGVAIGFAAIGLFASAVPALRASRVDPVITLNAS
jgi:putative ABC transport system permease protein